MESALASAPELLPELSELPEEEVPEPPGLDPEAPPVLPV
jgi:hypothetical protein